MGTQDFCLAMCLNQHLSLSSKNNLQKDTAQHKRVISPSCCQYKLGTENETGLTCWNYPTLPFHQHILRTHKELTKKNKSSQHSNHSFPVAKSSHLQLSNSAPKKGICHFLSEDPHKNHDSSELKYYFKKSTVP